MDRDQMELFVLRLAVGSGMLHPNVPHVIPRNDRPTRLTGERQMTVPLRVHIGNRGTRSKDAYAGNADAFSCGVCPRRYGTQRACMTREPAMGENVRHRR
jgi:hypothetical protein